MAVPTNSNPESHVYVAVLSRTFPVNVTAPKFGAMGSGHVVSATKKVTSVCVNDIILVTKCNPHF